MTDAARGLAAAGQSLLTQLGALIRVIVTLIANFIRRAWRWTKPRLSDGLRNLRARRPQWTFNRAAFSDFPRRWFGARADARSQPEAMPARQRRWPRALPLAVAFCALLSVFAAGALVYTLATIPVAGGLQIDPSQSALTLEADGGQVFATRGIFKGEKLTTAAMPDHLAKAIIAIEDRRFFSHSGIDLRGTLRALWRNTQAGGTREGGSTITQQLARLMYLSPDRNLRRKIQEAVIALWLESQLTKDEILLRYLNTAYFGAGAYGVDAAAQRYFSKKAKDLNLKEAAMLAGLVRAPSQLAPTRNLGGARERADMVLQAMVETGAITAQQADAARAQSVQLRTPPETPPGANHFVDMVTGDLRRILGPASGDLTIRTTLNLELQRLAEGVIERKLESEGAKKNVSQAALIAMAPDGAILAMVGGRDYEQSQFNRATQAKRQTGSIFKLFVYLAALQRGYTPQSVLVDRPISIGDWEPQNANNRFRGPVNLRTAFAQSINTVAVQLADEVGIPAVIETAKRLGVHPELPNVPSLSLGAGEVTLLEMTRAFGIIASGNPGLDVYSARTISGGSAQQMLYARRPNKTEAPGRFAEQRAMMLELLQAVVTEGTGKNARLPNVASAGKTGTTQESRDAWFVGFTQELIVGVWVGNDDNTPMNRVYGGDLPASIWRDFVLRGRPMIAGKPGSGPVAAGSPAPQKRPAQEAQLRGIPEVLDTGTLVIRGKVIPLEGISGERGRLVRQLASFLRSREVICESSASNQAQRCSIDGEDLSAMILEAGGARASADAPPALLAAEERARAERLGIWRRSY